MKIILGVVFVALGLSRSCNDKNIERENDQVKPRISFTFDDGQINDIGPYKLEKWNQMLLDNLEKHNLRTILFSSGRNKSSEKGRYILSSWNDAGHLIANHTFSHPNFNSEKVTLENFKSELIRNDGIINKYSNYLPYFRFPYLKEGNSKEKVKGFRQFLKEKGYKNGYVTVDGSDWYIDSRLVQRIKQNPDADISGFGSYYKMHLLERALFYDSLAYELTHRRINHVLLLHHNMAAA